MSLSDWNSTTTDALDEGITNKYFTDQRARNVISSASASLIYGTTTGELAVASGYEIPTTVSTTYWNNNSGIVNSNYSNWNNSYNTITASSSYWDSAYSWGNHASAGYLKVESDPIWNSVSTSLSVSNFTTTSVSQWTNDIGYLTVESDPIWTSAYGTLDPFSFQDQGIAQWTNDAGYLTTSTGRLILSSNATGLTYNNTTGVFSLTSGYKIPLTVSTTNWNIASDILQNNYGNWDTAYSWGNHADAGYLTSYTESDPIWSLASTSLTVSNFASPNISQWTNNSGYLTSYTESDPIWSAVSSSYALLSGANFVGNLSVIGTTTFATTTFTGDILPDMTGATGYVSLRNIGNSTNQFKDIYTDELHLGPHSLYVNGVQVISDDSSRMNFTADTDQIIRVKTSGGGNLLLESDSMIQATATSGIKLYVPSVGSGNITLQNSAIGGNIVLTGDGNSSNILLTANQKVGLYAPTIDLFGDLKLGTISSGTWNGSIITASYGGTGISGPLANQLLIANASGNGWTQISTSTLGLLTTNISEGSNLYYTDQRARGSISTDAIGLTYSNITGIFSLTSGYNIPLTVSTTNWNNAYNLVNSNSSNWDTAFSWGNHADAGYLTSYTETDPIWNSVSSSYMSLSDWNSTTTDALDEGITNKYFSNTLARQSISETIQGISYNNGTGVFSLDGTYSIPLTVSTTNWNNSYNIVTASSTNWDNAYSLVNAGHTNWDTAYSWGNHASAGYALLSGANFIGDLSVGGKATITASSGNIATAGTLNIAGATILNSTLSVTATTTLSNDLIVDLNSLYVDSVNNRVGIGTASPSYKLEVVGTTSTDAIRSYVGFDIYQVAEPIAPTCALIADGGTGNLGVGDYYYDVVYTTALGKTRISPLSSKITTDATHKQVTVTIPVSTDPRVTGRIIYRTSVGDVSTNAKVLATINNNVDATYVDNIADASLGALFPYWEPNSTNNQITINGTKAMTLDPNATMFGYLAGSSITSAGESTLFGANAGKALTSGMRSVFIGAGAGYSVNSGTDNVTVGRNSLSVVTTGNYNTALGTSAAANIGTASASNVAVGWNALTGVAGNSNYYNVAIGARAGQAIRTGGSNTIVGYYAGAGTVTTGNNIFLGYYAGKYETGANTLIIDSLDRTNEATSRTSALIYGINNATPANQILALGGGGKVGIGTTTPNSFLQIYNATSTASALMFTISTSTSGGGANIFKVKADGNVTADGTYTSPAADYGEYFYTDDTNLSPGEAVCIDVSKNNTIKKCSRGEDPNIMGIVSTKASFVGNGKDEYNNNNHYKIIGMLGQVPAYVSNENGDIRSGDSLTSASSTPGYLMKANAGDSTVGVALEDLRDSSGVINVLISRRNKSLSVEQIEDKITTRIADMKIEDEVAIMIANEIDNYNFASSTQVLIDQSLASTYDILNQTKDTIAILQDEVNRLKGVDYKTNVWDFIANADSMGKLYQVNLQNTNSYAFGNFNDIYVTGENSTGYSIYNKLSTALDNKSQTAFGNYIELQTSDSSDINYGSYIVSASDSKQGTQIGQYINLNNSASTTNWAIFVDNLGGKSYFGDNVFIGSNVPVMSWDNFNMTGDDLYVKGDLGIHGNIYADGSLYVKDNSEFLGDLLVIGDINSNGSIGSSNSGYAQMMNLSNSDFEYGDVVVLGENNNAKLSDKANSSNILGIITEHPAFISGKNEIGKPIVTMGKSVVNVTAANGIIKKGDYLTTSSETGKAQKATKLGAGVIGIALEDMKEDHDQIDVSVQIGYFNNHSTTIDVAKSGGDFSTILGALSSIEDNSEKNKYVINVRAGEYKETIQLKSYVDIVCEDKDNTKIIGSSAPAIIGANDSRIENCSLSVSGNANNLSVVSINGTSPVINNNKIISDSSQNVVGINIENISDDNMSPVISENEFGGAMYQGIANFASSNDMIIMNNIIENASGSAIATMSGKITSSGNKFKGILTDINIGENAVLFSTNDKFEKTENNGKFIDFTGNGNKEAHYVVDGFMLEKINDSSLKANLSSGEAYVDGVHVIIKPVKEIALLAEKDNYIYLDQNGEILVTSEKIDNNKVLLSTAKTDNSKILSISNDRQNEVIVAKQGGDYTTISEALSKIKLNSANNRWLITVKPGIYNEQITLKPYIDIVGSGYENTKITQINKPVLIASGKSSVSNISLANYADELGQEVVRIDSMNLDSNSTSSEKFSFAMNNVLIDHNSSAFAINNASSSAIKILSQLDNQELGNDSTSSAKLVDLKFNSIEARNIDTAIDWSLFDENWNSTSTDRLLSHLDISNSRLFSNYSDIKTRAYVGDTINSSQYNDKNAISLISSQYNIYSGSNLSFDLGFGTKLTTSHDNYNKVSGNNALVLNDYNRNVGVSDDLWLLQNNGNRIISVNGAGNILMSPQNVALDSFSMSQYNSSSTLTVLSSDNNNAANFFGKVVISPGISASGTPTGISELMFSSDAVISANGNELSIGKSGDTVNLSVAGVSYILPDSAVRDTVTAYVDNPKVDTHIWGNGENSWKPSEDIKILKVKAQYKCGEGGNISLRLEDKDNNELATISGGNCSNGYANIESSDLNINLTNEDGVHIVITSISGQAEDGTGPSQLTITIEYVYRKDLAKAQNSNQE